MAFFKNDWFAVFLSKIEGKMRRKWSKITKENAFECGWIRKYSLQLLTFAYKRLLNKPYENEVILAGQNPPLNCC